MKKFKPYIISFIISFAVAGLGGLVTYLNLDRYDSLIKPPFSPPAFLFPVVWTVLFAAMAFSAARVYLASGAVKTPALYIYAVQLILNLGWSVIYFGLGFYLFAFIWLLILWGSVLAMIILFYDKDKLSSVIQIHYLLWLSFAAYLNLAIYLINFT